MVAEGEPAQELIVGLIARSKEPGVLPPLYDALHVIENEQTVSILHLLEEQIQFAIQAFGNFGSSQGCQSLQPALQEILQRRGIQQGPPQEYLERGGVHSGKGRGEGRFSLSPHAQHSHKGYTLTHAGHQIRIGPVAFWIVVGALVVMGVWSIATGTYFAFRENVLTRLIGRQAEMQFAYGEPSPMAPGVARIVAANASALTFKGTNTYLVGTKSLGVIDPGPADPDHLAAILKAAGDRPITHILVTHAHVDHFDPELVLRHLAANPGAVVVAPPPAAARTSRRPTRGSPSGRASSSPGPG